MGVEEAPTKKTYGSIDELPGVGPSTANKLT